MRLRLRIMAAVAVTMTLVTIASLATLAGRATALRAAAAAAALQAHEQSWQAIAALLANGAGETAATSAPGHRRPLVLVGAPAPPAAGGAVPDGTMVLLDRAAAATGAVPVLTDAEGRAVAFPPVAAKLARVVERTRGLEPGTVEVGIGNRVVAVATVPLRDATGAVVGGRRWLTDVTERSWARDRDDLLAAAAVLGTGLLLTAAIGWWLRQAFRPLEQMLTAQQALARGDLTAALTGGAAGDEIGAGLDALRRFRDDRIALARRERADGWQRRIRLGFVEAQFERLMEAADEPDRSAIRRELRQLLAAADGPAGEDTLALALRAMAERVRGQERRLRGFAEARTEADQGAARLGVLEREFAALDTLQTRLAPPALPGGSGVAVAARLLSGTGFGGDLHDFFWLDGARGRRLAVLVAGVDGGGLDAAFVAIAARAAVRSLAPRADGPGECLSRVSDLLLRDNDRSLAVSAVLGFLDLSAERLVVACAGAPPPLLLPRPGDVRMLDVPVGPTLAVRPSVQIPEATLAVPSRASLVVVSRGVGATRRGGEALGADGLATILAGSPALDPEPLLAHAVRALTAPGVERPGDASVLVARPAGGPSAAA